jgi:hypothetical protein
VSGPNKTTSIDRVRGENVDENIEKQMNSEAPMYVSVMSAHSKNVTIVIEGRVSM